MLDREKETREASRFVLGRNGPRSYISVRPRFLLHIFAVLLLALLAPLSSFAETKRLVVIKVDGLPDATVERFVRERNPRTGKSLLPWIEHVFYQRGTRLANFYVRGMSLSGPSWSLLETGQHLQVKGNVEFDRYTLHSYDYLNFFPYYLNSARGKREDMPGAEVLDELGTPLLVDAFTPAERFLSFQLYQRGNRWGTLGSAIPERFSRSSPRELVDEWTIGFDLRNVVTDEVERELIQKLNNPQYRYLDIMTTEFDHAAHHNRDRETQLVALQELDAMVGRIWTGIQNSSLAEETVLVIVSDHGFNSDEKIYSQGYNLVKLLGSAAGGGHHVITKRRLLLDYSIKGINPLVPLITTTTADSKYLKKQSTDYPTALVDFDGNERSSIHLRDSDLNLLHILLQQLRRKKDVSDSLRRAMTEAFFSTIDRRRAAWQEDLDGLHQELAALHGYIEKQQAVLAAQPKKWRPEDLDAGRDQEARRLFAHVDSAQADEREYRAYARTLANLLTLRRETFDPTRIKIEDVIAKRAMGDRNSIYELQNYVVGVAPEGLQLAADGSLDMVRSFERVNYFEFLQSRTVINNVQPGVSNHPVDFVATRIPRYQIAPALSEDLQPDGDAVWVYGGEQQQALILSRTNRAGRLSLRYLPIANLREDENGALTFDRIEWRAGLPLKIMEDEQLDVPASSRVAWLDAWHTDVEWLRALHKTDYSNALIGLHEQMTRHEADALALDEPGLTADERLMRRFRKRQRELVEADLLILANNHWNFDVRGFNPGGNHGSFFRISTHSTLMLAGGERTGVPRGETVLEPYDSLSYVPTVLALMGKIDAENTPVEVLWQRGFRSFPGRIIKEVLGKREDKTPSPVARGAGNTP